MTTPGPSPNFSNSSVSSAEIEAEAQLQQELRAMFEVDTQQYLQSYFNLVTQLNPQSWAADIQNIYRAIHTVKGGAITVEAEAMLHTATALEDLLSELRYLEESPPLEDGYLSGLLLETGELLSSTIEITGTGELAIAQAQPSVQRIQLLHEQLKQRYFPDWNELTQVHQEFAEQGFDLVILELEMALDRIPVQGNLPEDIYHIAQRTLDQLIGIGQELQLAAGWTLLIERCITLIVEGNSEQWKNLWPEYFQTLKTCAKQSGNLSSSLEEKLQTTDVAIAETSSVTAPFLATDEFKSEFIGSEFSIELDPNNLPELEWLTEFLAEELGPLSRICLEYTPKDKDCSIEESIIIGDLTSLDLASLSNLPEAEWLSKLTLSGLNLDDISEEKWSSEPTLSNLILNDLPEEEWLSKLTLSGMALDNLEEEVLSELSASELPPEEWIPFTTNVNEDSLLPSSKQTYVQPETTLELADELQEELDFSDLLALGDLTELIDVTNVNLEAEESGLAPSNNILIPTALSYDQKGLFPTQPSQIDNNEVAAGTSKPPTPNHTKPDLKRGVQIPVPLERLDQSGQHVVETLLTARSLMSESQILQSQLLQLTTLTQESAQYVTRLRQLQDDYALLRNLSDNQNTGNNVTLERYRQGYTTINRLLENILRMSELGQEIETIAHNTTGHLDQLDRQVLRLKDGIETSRLVPFRNLALRARAIIRDLSNRYGKSAELIIEGEQIELDAGIVQQIEPALLHLLRNAYDHGLESPDERIANGKSAQGTIWLSVTRRGSLYRLVVMDDGGGIDGSIIQQLSESKGFALTQTRTAAELLAVMCQPGFSSRSSVTEVSGRGVGMDVVANQIKAMGGKLTLETVLTQGSTFTIDVPAPQLLVPCVLMKVGDRTLAFPTDEILETILLNPDQTQPNPEENSIYSWTIETSWGIAPGFDLANYWQQSSRTSDFKGRSLSDTAIGIRTRPLGKFLNNEVDLWFIADDLIGQAELLINPLPSPLISPSGLLGVSLQPDGGLISILDPVSLSEAIQANPILSPKSSSNDDSQTPIHPSSESLVKTILVVDDAALMRRRLEGSLNTYGFVTHACADGLEAWNWLQTNDTPHLMITDVEMPNMDGFTLIDRCRQAGINMPILVVSSRLSEEWGKEAQRLGANDYLNKGFSTSELINKVNQFLSESIPSR